MDVFSIGGRRSIAAGVAVVVGAATAPMVLGSGSDPAEISQVEGVAWLSNEADGSVVRVNGETGKVDARIDIGAVAHDLVIAQGKGGVLVGLGDEVRAIDVANLDWSGDPLPAEGELVVGDDAAYLVKPDGVVTELDPMTLEAEAEVDLGQSPGHGVVVKRKLVVPLDDGSVAVVDGDDVEAEVDAGDDGDRIELTRLGEQATVLNVSQGTLRAVDPQAGEASDATDVELPEGEVVVPRELPQGRLWVSAPGTGELVGLHAETGEATRGAITNPGNAMTQPAVVEGSIYVVDKTANQILEVDGETFDVQAQQLGAVDPGRVELVAVGGKAYVNDQGGNIAVVIDDGEYRRVDKYTNEGVAISTPPEAELPDPAPPSPTDTQPAPPGPTTTTTAVPPTGPPAPPAAVTAVAGNESATVSWAPGGGQFPATGWRVGHPGGDGPIEVPGGQLSLAVDGLNNGDDYAFEVWAVNEVGESSPVTSNTVTPNDEVPGAPGDVEAASDESEAATVTWSAADDRGNEIEQYLVTATPGETVTEVAGDRTEATIEGLTNDQPYTFTVTAVNDLGVMSEPSSPSDEVTPTGPPGAIGNVNVQEANGTVTLDWDDAPSSLPVTYSLSASPSIDRRGLETEQSQYSFPNLENGTTYTFTITPRNDRGAGPPQEARGTPGTQPTVNNVNAERTADRRFRVTFDVNTGGRAVDSCTVARGNATENCTVDGGSGSATVNVPTYATGYDFQVTVRTALGRSSATASGTSAKKPLVVDANSQDRWDGALCTWEGHENTRPYYAEPNHTCTSEEGYIPHGNTVRADCWTTGGSIQDDLGHTSNRWVHMGQGYMNTLYFRNWDANPESNLPRC